MTTTLRVNPAVRSRELDPKQHRPQLILSPGKPIPSKAPRDSRTFPRGPVLPILEVEAQLDSLGPRRHVMRPAEGGEVVVEHLLVVNVDEREAQTPLVPVAVEKIVVARGEIEEVAGQVSLRIVVVIFLTRRWYLDEPRAKLRRRTTWYATRTGHQCRYGSCRGRPCSRASKPALVLLVGSQWQAGQIVDQQNEVICRVGRKGARWCRGKARDGASHKPAVVSPVESKPWAALPGLILQMRRLIE